MTTTKTATKYTVTTYYTAQGKLQVHTQTTAATEQDARAMVAASDVLPSGWMVQATARTGRKLADVLDTRRF